MKITPRNELAGDPVLGVAIGTRYVGYAVANGQDLTAHGVLNLAKIRSQEGKEARFRRDITRLLRRHVLRGVIVVDPHIAQADSPAVRAFRTWLAQELDARALPMRRITRERVRVAPDDPEGPPRTNRSLARRLSQRFPELANIVPTDAELANKRWILPLPKERYWAPMFLALAAATGPLARRVLEEAARPRPIPPAAPPTPPARAHQHLPR